MTKHSKDIKKNRRKRGENTKLENNSCPSSAGGINRTVLKLLSCQRILSKDKVSFNCRGPFLKLGLLYNMSNIHPGDY